MSLLEIGNCRHYWQFNAANWAGDAFTDLVGNAPGTLSTGSPSYVTAPNAAVNGLDLSGGSQWLSFANTECLGEVSFIQVIGYRGGGQAYGLCTLSSTSGFNFWHGASANTAQWWRSANAQTPAQLSQTDVNITTSGVRLHDGLVFNRVDQNSEVTTAAAPDKNDAAVNSNSGWQFGRRYTTLDPIQQVYEIAAYIGDVTQADGYAAEIAALMAKYGK